MNQNDKKDGNKKKEEPPSGLGRAFDLVSGLFGSGSSTAPQTTENSVQNFFRAVRANKLDVVEEMLKQGFDPNTRNEEGITPLHLAARNNYPNLIKLLTDRGADPRLGTTDDPEHLPIDDAFEFQRMEALACLAQAGGAVASMLHRACEEGDLRLTQALLSANVDPTAATENGTTPLLIALLNRHSDIARALLQYPAVQRGINSSFTKTDPEKRTAFQLAAEAAPLRIVAQMIAAGGDVNTPNAHGWTPLHNAIYRGDVALVKTLVEHGADINKTSGDQLSPLLYACEVCGVDNNQNERRKIILYLLEMGADPLHADPATHQTALHIAAGTEESAVALRTLLPLAILDTEAVDVEGMTPLFYTIGRSSPRTLRALIEAAADVNARHMQDARTPLIHAVREGGVEDVRILLDSGANPWLCDASGKSALHYAREKNQPETLRLIEAALQQDIRIKKKPSSKPPGNTP